MRVKALVDHINDYSREGPGVALGEDRSKKKGDEYDIPDGEAKLLIDNGTVQKVSDKK